MTAAARAPALRLLLLLDQQGRGDALDRDGEARRRPVDMPLPPGFDPPSSPAKAAQPILNHIANVVRPALRKYLAAEQGLTDAVQSEAGGGACTARQDVMLAARQAVDVLHHLSDFVLKEPSASAAMGAFEHVEDVRSAVEAKGVFLRTAKPVADVRLLRDVANAFKHHRPERPSATVLVSSDVVSISIGWDQARWDEGKWDSPEQVIITTKDGDKRALWSVLQNVFDAWMTSLGEPLPPISQY